MPHSTQPEDSRHPKLWTAAWWISAPDIEIEAAEIIEAEYWRLRFGPDEGDGGGAV